MSGLTFFNLAGDILACGLLNSEEVVGMAEAAVRDYHFLLGMRAQAALRLILENPAGVLDFSEARFPGVRELCKVKGGPDVK